MRQYKIYKDSGDYDAIDPDPLIAIKRVFVKRIYGEEVSQDYEP